MTQKITIGIAFFNKTVQLDPLPFPLRETLQRLSKNQTSSVTIKLLVSHYLGSANECWGCSCVLSISKLVHLNS